MRHGRERGSTAIQYDVNDMWFLLVKTEKSESNHALHPEEKRHLSRLNPVIINNQTWTTNYTDIKTITENCFCY